jgi:hypothetical protein
MRCSHNFLPAQSRDSVCVSLKGLPYIREWDSKRESSGSRSSSFTTLLAVDGNSDAVVTTPGCSA